MSTTLGNDEIALMIRCVLKVVEVVVEVVPKVLEVVLKVLGGCDNGDCGYAEGD